MYTYRPPGQTPVYRPLGSQVHPVFLWQPYAPLSSSFDPQYGLVRQAETLHDDPDDKSDPSSADSSSTATSIDYQPRTALDTTWSEGVELGTVRGVASAAGDLGTNLSPRYAGYRYPIFPSVTTEYMAGQDRAISGQYFEEGSTVALPSPFLLPWQDDARKKPLAHKTKPCKFYATNGKCTSGEKCTFIHDPESKGNSKKSPPKLALPTDVKLPPKPLDKYDDCRARDFYPITWRVIGGGVMMGGQRQICTAFAAGHCKYGDDCKLAHETQVEANQVGFIEPKSEGSQRGQGLPQHCTKATPPKRVGPSSQRKFTKTSSAEVPQPEIFPSMTRPQRPDVPTLKIEATRHRRDGVVASSAPASPVHRRTQSMSMVLTSPSPLETHSNYAAEL
ncbi:hypothetical protein HD554DRAFT_2167231 [Boletus coccyginus]|nr:hypothetical protein HD554DRAFT_2167231 [Boletus coccyginus]